MKSEDTLKRIPANPLPPEIAEGDDSETDQWDDNDTPPRT